MYVVAAHLAKKDKALDVSKLSSETEAALKAFRRIKEEARQAVDGGSADSSSYKEVLAAKVYAQFTKGTKASKTIAAQYLAERLKAKFNSKKLTADDLRVALPKYLTAAIDYVTGSKDAHGGLRTTPGATDG